ncbi:MAG: anaerobic ribonucleoside-triphosphate reductase activating protein [archaeon]
MTEARLGSILDISTVDWPGRLSSVIFLAGCNLRCPFCQNAGLVPIGSGDRVDVSTIIDRIERNSGMIEVVGFCGGEPTLQEQVLTEICRHAKDCGLETFVNTNGTQPTVISQLSSESLLDFLTLDIKAPLNAEDYQRVIGVSDPAGSVVRKVTETLETCIDAGLKMEARTTIVPGLTDDSRCVKLIAGNLPKDLRYVLQQFNPEGDILDTKLRQAPQPPREKLLDLGRIALEEGLTSVYVRTREKGLEQVVT